MLIGLVICAGSFLATYLGFVRTPAGQRCDINIFVVLDSGASEPVRADADHLLRTLGAIAVLLICCLIVFLIAAARGQSGLGFTAATVIPGTIAASRLFKLVVLSRPKLGVAPIVLSSANSFPSGHTTAAAAVGIAFLLVVPQTLRTSTAVLSTMMTATAGLAVVVAGWHRPSDAVGAAALAGTVYCCARLVCNQVFSVQTASSTRELLRADRGVQLNSGRGGRHRLQARTVSRRGVRAMGVRTVGPRSVKAVPRWP